MPTIIVMLLTLVPQAEAKKGGAGMMMPDLAKVMGDAYQVPPELTNRAQPGSVLRWSGGVMREWKSGCLSAKPKTLDLTSVRMQSRLAGGVRMSFGGVGARGEAAEEMALNFAGPYIVTYEESDIRGFTPACDSALRAEAKRGGLNDLVLVEEAMFAKVNGCKKIVAKGGLGLLGRGVTAQAGGVCELISDKPVVVGLRTRPVASLLSVTPVAPQPAVRPVPTAAPVAKQPTVDHGPPRDDEDIDAYAERTKDVWKKAAVEYCRCFFKHTGDQYVQSRECFGRVLDPVIIAASNAYGPDDPGAVLAWYGPKECAFPPGG